MGKGKMDEELERQVCVTGTVCLKFGSSYTVTPLILSHLHRNVQLDLIKKAEGEIELGVEPKASIWGQAWS